MSRPMSTVAPSPASTTTSFTRPGNRTLRARFKPDAIAFWLPNSEWMLCTATIGNTRLVQPVEPTMTVSSGLGSEARM